MRIGIASGHSRNTNITQRRFEWERCSEAEIVLVQLLTAVGPDVVQPTDELYDIENNPALQAKIRLFNDSQVDFALELHLNGGGGDYSAAIYWDSEGSEWPILAHDRRPTAELLPSLAGLSERHPDVRGNRRTGLQGQR